MRIEREEFAEFKVAKKEFNKIYEHDRGVYIKFKETRGAGILDKFESRILEIISIGKCVLR